MVSENHMLWSFQIFWRLRQQVSPKCWYQNTRRHDEERRDVKIFRRVTLKSDTELCIPFTLYLRPVYPLLFLTPTCRLFHPSLLNRCNDTMWKVHVLKLLLAFLYSFLLVSSSPLICTFVWNTHANCPSFLTATDKVHTHTHADKYTE